MGSEPGSPKSTSCAVADSAVWFSYHHRLLQTRLEEGVTASSYRDTKRQRTEVCILAFTCYDFSPCWLENNKHKQLAAAEEQDATLSYARTMLSAHRQLAWQPAVMSNKIATRVIHIMIYLLSDPTKGDKWDFCGRLHSFLLHWIKNNSVFS